MLGEPFEDFVPFHFSELKSKFLVGIQLGQQIALLGGQQGDHFVVKGFLRRRFESGVACSGNRGGSLLDNRLKFGALRIGQTQPFGDFGQDQTGQVGGLAKSDRGGCKAEEPCECSARKEP